MSNRYKVLVGTVLAALAVYFYPDLDVAGLVDSVSAYLA